MAEKPTHWPLIEPWVIDAQFVSDVILLQAWLAWAVEQLEVLSNAIAELAGEQAVMEVRLRKLEGWVASYGS